MTPKEALQKYWGYSEFRPVQEEIIESIIDGKDTVALLPTGGGKSICYQIPSLVMEGTTLVISPLIALMQDQIQQLEKRDIKAIALHSGMHFSQIQHELESAANGRYKMIYVSPERLQNLSFRTWLKSIKLNFIAVDEAHCISQWGHDFRPSYRKISSIKQEFNIPCIALTASATPKVALDIVSQLELKNAQTFSKSFVRENISLSLFNLENKQGKILDILKKTVGSTIVYVRNRKKCNELSSLFQQNGISSTFYHGGLPAEEREEKQNLWIENQVRCMVCTNAFGMGIDKPDVRFVIHDAPPENLEAYYQEAGRAGRDGKKSYAVMLYNRRDIDLSEKLFNLKFPKEKVIINITNALYNYYQIASGAGAGMTKEFSLNSFKEAFKLEYNQVYHVLKILASQEIIHLTEAVYASATFKVKCSYQDLYNYRLKHEKTNKLFEVLLREKQDVFESYNNLNLQSVAKKLKIQEEQLKRHFFHLHQQNIIEFKPATDKPILTFLKDRPQNILLNTASIKELKNMYSQKWIAMKEYLSKDTKCRMNKLVAYFGEEKKHQCEICDTCILSRKETERKERIAKDKEKIISQLSNKMLSSKQLLGVFSSTEVLFAQEALRILLDEGIIVRYNNTSTFCLKEKE